MMPEQINELLRHYGEHRDVFYDRLADALRTARNAGLEELAQKYDKLAEDNCEGVIADPYFHDRAIEARALKHKDGQP